MSAVWGTIRDALKAAAYTDFNAMPFERESAMLDAMAADLEAKLTLLTPAHAAVIGTVKQFLDIYNNEKVSDPNAAAWAIGEMEGAVATLRELEERL